MYHTKFWGTCDAMKLCCLFYLTLGVIWMMCEARGGKEGQWKEGRRGRGGGRGGGRGEEEGGEEEGGEGKGKMRG